MKWMTKNINDFTLAVRSMNPDTIMDIAKGLGLLGLALTGAGGVAIVAALGPLGWVVIAAAGIAAVIYGLTKIPWGEVWSGLKDIGAKIVEAIGFSARFAIGAIPEIFSQLGSAILDALKNVISQVGRGLGIDPANKGTSPGQTGRPWKENIVPQSFSPGQRTMTAQPIQISMNIDGRSLGQAVSEQLMYLATFSGSAPSANGMPLFTGGDHNANI